MNLVTDIGLNAEMPAPEEAEVQLPLYEMGLEEAVSKLHKTIDTCCKQSVASLFISFEPASKVGDKCLFGPIGREIRALKNDKVIFRTVPLLEEERAGFFVFFQF